MSTHVNALTLTLTLTGSSIVLLDGALVSRGMPKFDYLSDSHLVAINSFLLGKAWESYEDEDNVPYEKENTNK